MPPFITAETRTRHLRSHSSSSRRRESATQQTPLGEQSRTTNTRNPSRTCSSSLVVRHIVHNVRSGAWGSHAQGPEHDVRGTPPSSQGRDRFHDELPLPQRSCAELQMLHGEKRKRRDKGTRKRSVQKEDKQGLEKSSTSLGRSRIRRGTSDRRVGCKYGGAARPVAVR